MKRRTRGWAFAPLCVIAVPLPALADGAPAATLECTVVASTAGLAPGFAAAFCRELAAALKNDLSLAVPGARIRDGFAIAVKIRPVSATLAHVSIGTSRIDSGVASPARTSQSRLVGHDGALRPKAASALAYPILSQIRSK